MKSVVMPIRSATSSARRRGSATAAHLPPSIPPAARSRIAHMNLPADTLDRPLRPALPVTSGNVIEEVVDGQLARSAFRNLTPFDCFEHLSADLSAIHGASPPGAARTPPVPDLLGVGSLQPCNRATPPARGGSPAHQGAGRQEAVDGACLACPPSC